MNEFYYYLQMALGVTKDTSGRIIDQDTGLPIIYNTGYLVDQTTPHILHRNDTKFTPETNKKLSLFLLQFLLKKMEDDDDDVYVRVMYPELNSSNGKYRFCVATENDTFSSDYYYLESLQYLDLIFKISEIGTQYINLLHTLDVKPE